MTLPSDILLPAVNKELSEDPEKLFQYLRDLTYDLEKMYGELATAVNGRIGSNDDISSAQYTPTIISTGASAGLGTYDHQIGWVLRRGLMVDVWFDLQWTAHTGTAGSPMAITLPYLVAQSSQKPFFGTLYASNITYAGDYLVCNAEPGTRNCNIWEVTTAAAGGEVNLDTAGQLAGHIRYIGQGIERT